MLTVSGQWKSFLPGWIWWKIKLFWPLGMDFGLPKRCYCFHGKKFIGVSIFLQLKFSNGVTKTPFLMGENIRSYGSLPGSQNWHWQGHFQRSDAIQCNRLFFCVHADPWAIPWDYCQDLRLVCTTTWSEGKNSTISIHLN